LEKPYSDPETGKERIGALLGVERPIIQLGGKLRESRAETKMGRRRVFLDHETAERQRWCGRRGKQRDRNGCSHFVIIRGQSNEVTVCR
jgi:hypothetical protein